MTTDDDDGSGFFRSVGCAIALEFIALGLFLACAIIWFGLAPRIF
jgi:hypothetical protein